MKIKPSGLFDVRIIKTRRDAKRFILSHVENYPDEHRVPEHLVDTYSGMFGHPVFYCKTCKKLIEKFKIRKIKGLKKGMWHAYVECPKEQSCQQKKEK